jgi:hypothetical protein
MACPMRKQFEKKLVELGLSYSVNHDNIYAISSQTGSGNNIIVRLISSLPSIKKVNGSKNGNDIQAIGLFNIKPPIEGQAPDLFILALQNPVKNRFEFLIIPPRELNRRLIEGNRSSTENQKIVFWLMPDNCLYLTTEIGIESEWYYLSKGVNGRMADRTDADYTEFLNSWGRLSR